GEVHGPAKMQVAGLVPKLAGGAVYGIWHRWYGGESTRSGIRSERGGASATSVRKERDVQTRWTVDVRHIEMQVVIRVWIVGVRGFESRRNRDGLADRVHLSREVLQDDAIESNVGVV